MTEPSRKRAFQAGMAVAMLASLLTIWTTIVRDDSTGGTYFMLILAIMVGWFAAGFRPAGMARTMLGVAVMQMVNGLLMATAPVIANVPGGSLRALLFNAGFAALWLSSAALFHLAAGRGDEIADAR